MPYRKTTQTPAPENEKKTLDPDLVFHKCLTPAGVDSGSVATSNVDDPSFTLKTGLLFSIFQ